MFRPSMFRNDPFFSPTFFPRTTFPSLFDFPPVSAPMYLYEVSDPSPTSSTKQPQLREEKQPDRLTSPKDVKDSARQDQRVGSSKRSNRSLFSPLPSLLSSGLGAFAGAGGMDMRVDMFSTPSAYSVHALVPGVDKKDISVTVDDHVLTIQAERRERRSTQSTPRTIQPQGKEAQSGQMDSTPMAEEKYPDQSSTATSTSGPSSSTTSQGSQGGQGGESQVAMTDGDGVDWHHVESFYGVVSRRVQLPEDALVEELTARYEDGIIKVEVPRTPTKQQQQGRRIEIQ